MHLARFRFNSLTDCTDLTFCEGSQLGYSTPSCEGVRLSCESETPVLPARSLHVTDYSATKDVGMSETLRGPGYVPGRQPSSCGPACAGVADDWFSWEDWKVLRAPIQADLHRGRMVCVRCDFPDSCEALSPVAPETLIWLNWPGLLSPVSPVLRATVDGSTRLPVTLFGAVPRCTLAAIPILSTATRSARLRSAVGERVITGKPAGMLRHIGTGFRVAIERRFGN